MGGLKAKVLSAGRRPGIRVVAWAGGAAALGWDSGGRAVGGGAAALGWGWQGGAGLGLSPWGAVG